MCTGRGDVQEPAVGILEEIDILVRDLPEQMIEIFLALGGGDLLIDRVTTDRLFALGTFLVNLDLAGTLPGIDFDQLDGIFCVHTPAHD